MFEEALAPRPKQDNRPVDAIDIGPVRAILEREIAMRHTDEDERGRYGGLESCAREIGGSGTMTYESAARRIGAITSNKAYKGRNGKLKHQEWVAFDTVDRLLTGLGILDWHMELAPSPDLDAELLAEAHVAATQECEDCGGDIEEGVEPIDLFRHEPDAPAGKRRRAGGRRFRLWHLCRRCRAAAIRKRAGTTSGRTHKYIPTNARIAPKRGGRPPLLTDEEIRAAYSRYLESGLSRRALAKLLWEERGVGSWHGHDYALLAGWRRMQLPLREAGVPYYQKRHPTIPCAATGVYSFDPCRQWVRLIDGKPAEDGLCWNHAHNTKKELVVDGR